MDSLHKSMKKNPKAFAERVERNMAAARGKDTFTKEVLRKFLEKEMAAVVGALKDEEGLAKQKRKEGGKEKDKEGKGR